MAGQVFQAEARLPGRADEAKVEFVIGGKPATRRYALTAGQPDPGGAETGILKKLPAILGRNREDEVGRPFCFEAVPFVSVPDPRWSNRYPRRARFIPD